MITWALVMAFFGPFITIVSSMFSILASAFSVVTPLLQGIVAFFVWYIKTFFQGLVAIFTAPSSLAVIGVLLALTAGSIVAKERNDCFKEVDQQRKYDAYMEAKRTDELQKQIVDLKRRLGAASRPVRLVYVPEKSAQRRTPVKKAVAAPQGLVWPGDVRR